MDYSHLSSITSSIFAISSVRGESNKTPFESSARRTSLRIRELVHKFSVAKTPVCSMHTTNTFSLFLSRSLSELQKAKQSMQFMVFLNRNKLANAGMLHSPGVRRPERERLSPTRGLSRKPEGHVVFAHTRGVARPTIQRHMHACDARESAQHAENPSSGPPVCLQVGRSRRFGSAVATHSQSRCAGLAVWTLLVATDFCLPVCCGSLVQFLPSMLAKSRRRHRSRFRC